jgi:hypothetical protein
LDFAQIWRVGSQNLGPTFDPWDLENEVWFEKKFVRNTPNF